MKSENCDHHILTRAFWVAYIANLKKMSIAIDAAMSDYNNILDVVRLQCRFLFYQGCVRPVF